MNIQTKLKIGFSSRFALNQVNGQTKIRINLDLTTTVKPNNDFFPVSVNGTWIKKNTEIPADKTIRSFDELRQNIDKDALAILNAAKTLKYKSNTDQKAITCTKLRWIPRCKK
jgi:predicted metalloendopeptidase